MKNEMKNTRNLNAICVLACAFVFVAQPCVADLICSDSFTNGTVGASISSVNPGGGFGWTYTVWTNQLATGIYTNGLTYPAWDATGNAIAPSGNNGTTREYSSPTGTGGHGTTNWFSLLICSLGPTGPAAVGNRLLFFNKAPWGSSSWGAGIELENGTVIKASLGGILDGSGVTVDVGAVNLVIGRVIWHDPGTDDEIKIWVNPTNWRSEGDLNGMTAELTRDFSDATTKMAGVYLRTGGSQVYIIDEIRLGQTLEDVRAEPLPVGTVVAIR